MNEAIYEQLRDETKYNYLYELVQLDDSHPLKKTVELITFGDYKLYQKYQDQAELDQELLGKLVELTLISISNEYDNGTITLAQVEEEYGISQLDEHIIKLVDNKIIDVKIDQANDCLIFGNVITLRDCYDKEMYTLTLLTEEDIPNRSFGQAVNRVEEWYQSKLKPMKEQFKK